MHEADEKLISVQNASFPNLKPKYGFRKANGVLPGDNDKTSTQNVTLAHPTDLAYSTHNVTRPKKSLPQKHQINATKCKSLNAASLNSTKNKTN